ncbi:MAG: hypothetical protein J0I06_14990 [Planctomycetes bacterium]|nr:hypothetical protein [Planctomycetota bacterium]
MQRRLSRDRAVFESVVRPHVAHQPARNRPEDTRQQQDRNGRYSPSGLRISPDSNDELTERTAERASGQQEAQADPDVGLSVFAAVVAEPQHGGQDGERSTHEYKQQVNLSRFIAKSRFSRRSFQDAFPRLVRQGRSRRRRRRMSGGRC